MGVASASSAAAAAAKKDKYPQYTGAAAATATASFIVVKASIFAGITTKTVHIKNLRKNYKYKLILHFMNTPKKMLQELISMPAVKPIYLQ